MEGADGTGFLLSEAESMIIFSRYCTCKFLTINCTSVMRALNMTNNPLVKDISCQIMSKRKRERQRVGNTQLLEVKRHFFDLCWYNVFA